MRLSRSVVVRLRHPL